MSENYILVYGNRRLEACKKLKWAMIPCVIDKGETKELPISSIKVLDNSRIRIDKDDLGELMLDIKNRGLLEPIGVSTEKDYNKTTDFIIDNLAENIHRKDLSPYEECLTYEKLIKKGYSINEISSLTNRSVKRIQQVLNIYKKIPEEYKKKLYRDKKDGITVTLADKITCLKVSPSKIKKILEYAHKNNLSVSDILTLKRLISSGIDIEEALKMFNSIVAVSPTIVVDRKMLNSLLEKYDVKMSELIRGMLKGIIEVEHKLFI